MNSSQCWDFMSLEQQEEHCSELPTDQETLEEPMPWIGMYIATVTLFCSLAMSGDILKGIRHRRFWLPCKFFSLNALSLSLLAVVLKLSMDFSNTKVGYSDAYASLTSLVFMSIAMGNFMTSVGSMDDRGITSNLTGLVVLVVTIAVNIFLYSNQLDKIYNNGYELWGEQVVVTVFLLVLLIPFCSLGVVVDATKTQIDFKFREMHNMLTDGRVKDKRFSVDELKIVVKKYWVMAETGSMQFVIARSAICVIPSLVCLVLAFICIEAAYRMELFAGQIFDISSSYKWSIIYIICVQILGIAIGLIAPLSRWYIAANIRRSMLSRRSLTYELKMETYWTRRLADWRESRIPSQIHSHGWKIVLHVSQRTVLYLLIKIQTIFVLASKLVLMLSVLLQAVIFMFIRRIVKIITYPIRPSSYSIEFQDTSIDFSQYVLLLEGEVELPKDTIANICKGFDSRIKRGPGTVYKHRKLVHLLKESESFNGVLEFDSNKVATLLYDQEPPNCWSLPLVTLACIVQAVPQGRSLTSPLPALRYAINLVKLVESMLDKNAEQITIGKAADIVWDDLELHSKWQDTAISRASSTYKDTLCQFYALAMTKVRDFQSSTSYSSSGNSLNWPPKFIAANSMYRICGSLLLTDDDQTDDQMFKRLAVTISDILVACLTNLPRAIIMQCDSTIIAKKEESVRRAARLIYEVSEILELVEQRKWPHQLDPEEAGNIDAWRAVLSQENINQVTSVSETDNKSVPGSPSVRVFIGIEN